MMMKILRIRLPSTKHWKKKKSVLVTPTRLKQMKGKKSCNFQMELALHVPSSIRLRMHLTCTFSEPASSNKGLFILDNACLRLLDPSAYLRQVQCSCFTLPAVSQVVRALRYRVHGTSALYLLQNLARESSLPFHSNLPASSSSHHLIDQIRAGFCSLQPLSLLGLSRRCLTLRFASWLYRKFAGINESLSSKHASSTVNRYQNTTTDHHPLTAGSSNAILRIPSPCGPTSTKNLRIPTALFFPGSPP